MKINRFAPQKSRAQAMVEFAIVLPLLLLLLYGLLEAGRLLFVYSTIVTATRQAVRYGSATGEGINPGVPRFQDCAGIRLAAQRVDFLNAFDDVDIYIAHDGGPGTAEVPYCGGDPVANPPPTSDTYDPQGNDERLLVRIEGDFLPIVPRIVPFIARTVATGNPITGVSARTILTGVEIYVSPPPGSGGGVPSPGTNQLELAMSASATTYAFAGDIINFTYTLTNNGTVDLSGISLTPTHGAWSCPGTTLAVGASMTCTGAYQISAADVTAGSVTAQVTATGTDGITTVTSNTGTVVLTFVILPQLTLDKTASTEYAPEGGTITYTFTLTNTGNVPLSAPYVINDNRVAATCPATDALPLGASTTCTGAYVVTSADARAQQLVNTASATAMYGTQPVTSNTDSASVWTGPLFLSVSASPASASAVGQVITYSYLIINNTGAPLYAPYTLSGHRGTENCSPNPGGLPAGIGFTCTGSYAIQQADLDSQATLVNSVTATACRNINSCNGANQVTSNTDQVIVTMVRNPALSMTIIGAGPNPSTTLDAVLTYTYAVTNTGNVTLAPTITDSVLGTVTCPGALAPGATYNCTGTYRVTQTDLDNGSITNLATATALFNGQPVSSASQSVTLFTYVGPRVRLQITPNPTTFTGVGQFIVYTYTMKNTGSVPLYGPYTINDSKVTFVDCLPATSPLGVGASTTCVGSYATTQADMDAGSITTSANAIASDGTQTVISNSAMAVVYVPGSPTVTPVPGPTATRTPTPTATSTPTTNLKVQLRSNGDDDDRGSNFNFQVQNVGTAAAANVSVRIYFSLDASRPATDYQLQRTGGGAASISGPTLVSGTTYYFTVSNSTPIPANGTWSVNLLLDLKTGPNNFSSANDWWHNGSGALPAGFSDWTSIPAYVSGSRVWGSEP